MREVFYESKKIKVYQDGDKFEIFTISARDLDGWYDVSLNHQVTYTDVYMRDWLGRTSTWPSYNRNKEKGYALKMVLEYIEWEEIR